MTWRDARAVAVAHRRRSDFYSRKNWRRPSGCDDCDANRHVSVWQVAAVVSDCNHYYVNTGSACVGDMLAVFVVVAVAVVVALAGIHCDDYRMTDVPVAVASSLAAAVLVAVVVVAVVAAAVPQTQSDVHIDSVHHRALNAPQHSCWRPGDACVPLCWADVAVAVVCLRA